MNYIFFNRDFATKQAFLHKILTDFGVILKIRGEYIQFPNEISQGDYLEIKKVAEKFTNIVHQNIKQYCVLAPKNLTKFYLEFFVSVLEKKPLVYPVNFQDDALIFEKEFLPELIIALEKRLGEAQ